MKNQKSFNIRILDKLTATGRKKNWLAHIMEVTPVTIGLKLSGKRPWSAAEIFMIRYYLGL